MAGKNQVTLTFAGDSSKLTKAFDDVGAHAKTMDTDVGNASRSIGEKSQGGFDKAGNAADGAEGKAQGFSDTLTGGKDVMEGFGEIAKGNLFDGLVLAGTGVADLAGGMATFLIPMAKTGILKAFAAAQWLINAAMSANPIGLVVLAIVLLIAIFVIAWKKSDTFRAIVTGAFKAVWDFVKKVGGWFKDTLWPWLKGVFDKINSAVSTAKDWIVRKFTEAVNWLKGLPGKIGSAVSTAWDKLKDGARAAKDWAVTKFTELVTFVKGLPKKITSAASGMFDGIKNAFKAALNWLIGKWNGLSFTIPSVTVFGKTVGGATISTPDIPYFHQGGIVPGGLGSETLAMLRAGEKVTGGSNQPAPQQMGPIYLEAHIDLGNDVTKVVQVEFREMNRQLKRDVMAGAR